MTTKQHSVVLTAPLPSLGTLFTSAFAREWVIAFRNRADLANPLLFFFSILMFIPLGVSPDPKVLGAIAPGIIWTVALLATLLSLDRLFVGDYEDGGLEQMLASGQPMFWLVLAKIIVHWLVTGLPLTLLSPLLGVMMSLPSEGYMALVVSLAIGTFVLSLIGAIGAALTVTLRKGGLLLSLIIMPLYVPVLVFGATAVTASIDGVPIAGHIAVIGAMLAISLVLAPAATAGALKINLRH